MKIIYYDKNIIVCIKPIGIDSQNQVPSLLKEQFSGDIFTIHRLDLNVSGIMVYARNKKYAAYLSRCIQEGTMIKEYIAMVHGIPPKKEIWEDYLWKDSHSKKVFVVKRLRKGVKKAKLEFERITEDEKSLVHIRLYTGRTHQIRVQFASRGFPLVGDHKYGSKDTKKTPMLYSYKITFPYQGTIKSFKSLPQWSEYYK